MTNPTDPTVTNATISDVIRGVWERGLPQTRERVALLLKAAEELSETRSIDPLLREEALSIAHKLAGSLGMFGYADATDHARAIEAELSQPGLPQPERLQASVDALKASLPL